VPADQNRANKNEFQKPENPREMTNRRITPLGGL
jgi:hypothetical protein